MSKQPVEIRQHYSEECGRHINVLFIGGEMFDYLMDEQSLLKAKVYCHENPHLRRAVRGDILKHFLDCLQQFIGWAASLEDVNEAIRKGEIDVHH